MQLLLLYSQQRVFAVQVFESHRLIKVQQLIAGSLDLLLEESAYLGRSSLKASPAKKFPSKYIVKPLPPIANSEDDSEKLNHKIERSAENAVEKTSLSSVKNGSQPSNYGPYLVNQPPPPVAADSGMGPWCLHELPGQQWLIPIMSPSEGLVYKPFPGPGFMGTVCGGGCTPLGPIPNFMHPAYGIPSPLPPQGNGIMLGAHPAGHSYFPPYGIPVMNPSISDSAAEQNNQFAGPGSNNQFSQPEANLNLQHESTCNVTVQNNGAVLPVRQFQAFKDTELHGNTASSPGDRMQGDGMGHAAEGRDALHLFTASPVAPEVEMHFIFSPQHQLLRWQHLRLMTQTSQ